MEKEHFYNTTPLIKPIKYILLITAFCFCSFISNAQIDSLLNVLKTAKEDTTKVNTLNTLFLSYEFTDDSKAKECLEKALELSKKIDFKKGLATTYTNCGYFAEDKSNYPEALKNYQASLKASQAIGDKNGIAFSYNNIGVINYYQGNYEDALKNHFTSLKIKESILLSDGKVVDKKGIANSHNNIGNVYFVQGNYKEAIKNYAISLKIYEEMGNKIGLTASYNNIANVCSDQGNYPEALKNYFAALKIYEAIGNDKGKAITYNNIGAVYYNQGNYSEALKKYSEALKIRISLGDKMGMATTYNNVANTYSDLGDYDKALENYSVSLKIREEIGDKAGLGDSYNNIGLIYYNQAGKEKNPAIVKDKLAQALKSYFSSLKMRETIGDKTGIANSYYNIGSLFIRQNKFKEAESYLNNAIKLSREIGYKTSLKSSYLALSEMDSIRANYKGAFENHKMYILYRDSLDNEETRKKIIQNQMTYDFEKKEAVATAEHKKEMENQNLLAEEKSRKQKIVLSLVLGSLLLVIIFSGFIFRSLRTTRKQKNIIEEQKNVVEQQKLEVEQQKLIVEEHQKEIIDSITYARRIQQSLLPTEKYIEKNLNRLNNRR